MTDVRCRPAVGVQDAVRVAQEHFGLQVAAARELPSERDRNFELRGDRGTVVCKFANPAEPDARLELQNRMLRQLEAEGLPPDSVPRLVPTTGGAVMPAVDCGGARLRVRCLTHLPGVPLARYRPHDVELLGAIGALLARIDSALSKLGDPGASPDEFCWDLLGADAVIARGAPRIADRATRARVDAIGEVLAREVLPAAAALPRSLIHNDANDYNVLVAARGPAQAPRVGLIDFGDAVVSVSIAELAVGIAYAVLGKRAPLAVACAMTAGYHGERQLAEDELRVLWPLARARLALSAANAAVQCEAAPDNDYLAVSQAAVAEALASTEAVHPRLAEAALRDACGLPASPHGARVGAWLAGQASALSTVLGEPWGVADATLLDASVGGGDGEALSAAAPEAGLALGRYDEARAVYTAAGFAVASDDGEQRRTVHLGVDLCAPAGTAVRAPLDGEVVVVADRDAELDYGPLVVLWHRPAGGPEFATLYGHLDPAVLDGLEVGQRVAAGRAFAAIGAPPRNGGWRPHLHLQVLADLLDVRTARDFPGVCDPAQRAVWTALCPDPSPLVGVDVRAPQRSSAALRAQRDARLGPSLSLAYDRPLQIVRGRGAHLFDADGRAYLDCVNNVCHVGHAHPRVVAALAAQAALLNTNTRYLHENLSAYAERLTARLPAPLTHCFFVCSGSEANELALRMARAATGRHGVVMLEGAYHGNTQALVDISPYKHDGPGGGGAPPWARAAALPHGYRGCVRGPRDTVGEAYAARVRDALAALVDSGWPPAAFIAESIGGVAGQIVWPDGYLAAAYRHARAAGALCIADEVQVGFGRVGSHFWAFESQGVVPDIVTLGKPIGNGHPLAAVVTTEAIARAFANGMEYFNTFGGNPVSCAVGMAVLDVIDSEQLMARADRVGAQLISGLREVQQRRALIGEVRGLGLFVGVELVTDRTERTPAAAHASRVCERLRARGILLSTDGPDHNVLKIKPPMVFSAADAERLVAELDAVLGEDALQVGSA